MPRCVYIRMYMYAYTYISAYVRMYVTIYVPVQYVLCKIVILIQFVKRLDILHEQSWFHFVLLFALICI